MAVFSPVAQPQLRKWLAVNYGLELAGAPEPILAGIENTNYRILCADGQAYVFTIIEVWPAAIAAGCLQLALHMHDSGQAVPRTLRNQAGSPCSDFAGKPAAVVSFAAGGPRLQPTSNECALMGEAVAKLHLAARGFAGSDPNQRGIAWRRQAAKQVAPHLGAADQLLLRRAQAADENVAAAQLDDLACHCDLFRNNVLWVDDRISGIIDFYFSGRDLPAFDLAVACIDWCMDDHGAVLDEHLGTMLGAYCGAIPLIPKDRALLANIFASAALRFWLSRHLDILQPRAASMLIPHDPGAFGARLATCLNEPERLLAAVPGGTI